MESAQQVGVIGLGAMGSGMASALMRAGFTVRGNDINPGALEAFAAHGGVAASTPAIAAEGAARIAHHGAERRTG